MMAAPAPLSLYDPGARARGTPRTGVTTGGR
jgi:hypothetical protein